MLYFSGIILQAVMNDRMKIMKLNFQIKYCNNPNPCQKQDIEQDQKLLVLIKGFPYSRVTGVLKPKGSICTPIYSMYDKQDMLDSVVEVIYLQCPSMNFYTWTYQYWPNCKTIHPLCADTRYHVENLPRVKADIKIQIYIYIYIEREREREREISFS